VGYRFLRAARGAKRGAGLLVLGEMVCAVGPLLCLAQTESPFAIRVEAPEVVVPVVVLDRTHFRMTQTAYEELDEEVTDLAVSDFDVFEDGVKQSIESVALELPRIRDVRDNISHHIENAFTPRGVWASPDLWPQAGGGPAVSPLATYLVSYVPPPSSGGSCHRIRVRVRRRHATVYARDEYCNVKHPLSDPIGGTRLGKAMEDFAESGQAGELPVSMQVGSFFGNTEVRHVDVAVEFPGSAVKRKWVGVNLYAMVAVLGVVRDKKGEVVARFSDMASSLPWNFYRGPIPPDRDFLKYWETAGIPTRYETQMELAPGEYDLRVVVTDGEKFGRVEVPVKVDGAHVDRLSVGDVILCNRFHEVLEGAQAAAGAPKYVPLVSEGVEFMPAGDTRFARGERLVSYFEIYEPSARAMGSANFQIRIVDAKSGAVKMDTGRRSVESDIRLKNRAIPIAAEMAIDKLLPGEYVLEVEASDTEGRVTAKQASFVIE